LPDNVVTERLIPVYLPPDSAAIWALFECDSNKQVILKAFNEFKSKSVQSDFSFESGEVVYKTKTVHDTIYIPAKDSLIYVPIEVPGEKVNYLTFWQQLWIYAGRLLVAALAVVFVLKKFILK
jgi:hypothetical protein